MATTIIYAETNDNHIESQHSTWASARAGTGTKTITAHPLAAGTYLNAGVYYAWEAFLSFDTSSVTGVDSAALSVQTYNPNHASSYIMEARLYDWGTAVETTDFIDGANLGNYTLLATFDTTGLTTQTTAEVPLAFSAVGGAWAANINTSGDTRIVIHSQKQRTNVTPTVDETATFYGTEATGTVDDPKLTIFSGAPSLVAAAQTTYIAGSPSAKTTPSFNVETGDVIVAYSFISDDLAGMYPVSVSSSPSHTWSSEADAFAGTGSATVAATKSTIANFTGSMTVTFTPGANSTTVGFGGGVMVIRGASNTGATNYAADSTSGSVATLALTTTAANSAIVFVATDWQVVDGNLNRAWLSLNGSVPVETTYDRQTGDQTVYAAFYSDAGAIGSKTVGLSAPTGMNYSAVAIEVLYLPSSANLTAELYEGGSLVADLGTVAVDAEGVYSFTWNAAALSALSGANVELRLTSDGDIDIGAVEWNAYRVAVTAIPNPVSDTPTVGITDTAAILSVLGRVDAPTVGVTDVSSILVTLARTDAPAVGVTDVAAILSTSALTDTVSVGISDSAVVTPLVTAVESWNSILM